MKYKDEELKKLQETELGILSEIIRVCDENDICYFSVGGTTLGALRHGGFIPWDDDIDIGMLRDDYEKFLKIAPSALRDSYILSHFSTEPSAPVYYAKVRKADTVFMEHYATHIDMNHGVFVDVMPYDRIPEGKAQRRRYYRRVKFWNQLYVAKTVRKSMSQTKKYRQFYSVLRAVLHVLLTPVSKAYLFRKTDEAMRAWNGSGSPLVSSRAIPAFTCRLKDIMPPREHPFETLRIKIPRNAEKLLQTQYGDYMKLPPEEKRFNHGPTVLRL